MQIDEIGTDSSKFHPENEAPPDFTTQRTIIRIAIERDSSHGRMDCALMW